MYIYHAAGFVDPVVSERESLKPRLKAVGAGTLRRAGRFNQLAVLGAAGCAEGIALPQSCDVMVVSVAGHISDSAAVLGDAIVKHQSPMPFAFMNTQGNSACYNVAKVLGLDGNSAFILHPDAPFESALTLARVQSQFSPAKLLMLGIVEEWTLPYYQPPTGYRQDDSHLAYEGSCWFAVGDAWLGCSPLARVLTVEQAVTSAQLAQRLAAIDLSQDVQWDVCSQARSLVASIAASTNVIEPTNSTALHENQALISWLQQNQCRYYCRIRANRLGGLRLLLMEML